MTNAMLRGLIGDLFRNETTAAEFSGDAFLARMMEFETAWTRALRAHRLVGDK